MQRAAKMKSWEGQTGTIMRQYRHRKIDAMSEVAGKGAVSRDEPVLIQPNSGKRRRL